VQYDKSLKKSKELSSKLLDFVNSKKIKMTKEPRIPAKMMTPRSNESKEMSAVIKEDIVSVSDCQLEFSNEYFSKNHTIKRKKRFDS
jgi:hypothetical protein